MALSAVLVSPWPAIAEESFPLTGKYYLLMHVGHVVALAAIALIIKGIYLRLLPDNLIGPFMTTFVVPVILAAAVIMTVCIVRSPITSAEPADHLYLVVPDVWLSVYWGVYLGVLTLLSLVAIYGLVRLRKDQRSAMVNLYAAAFSFGLVGVPVLSVAVNTGRPALAEAVVWPLGYVAMTAIAFAAGISWRQRVSALVDPRPRT
jgi:hypothetical protein